MSYLIEHAKFFATYHHEGQTRKFGDREYIYHPEQVFRYLNKFTNDENLLAAAWLHDVVEDCGVTLNRLAEVFNYHVTRYVDDVSQPPACGNRKQRWKIYLEHYAKATEGGKLLKLADRKCNLQEHYDFWDQLPLSEQKFVQEVYLVETKELCQTLNCCEAITDDIWGLVDLIDDEQYADK
jgi:(p)ppGpp synthase/HD superfamily hydrolase